MVSRGMDVMAVGGFWWGRVMYVAIRGWRGALAEAPRMRFPCRCQDQHANGRAWAWKGSSAYAHRVVVFQVIFL